MSVQQEDSYSLQFGMKLCIDVQGLCIGNAQIIAPNLPALNGYIHVINRVSIPTL